MHHLLNEHGNFYELAEFKTKFNLNVPFTAFYRLIDAIRNAWKNKIKQPFQIDNNNTANCNTTLSTSSIYSTILTHYFVPPTSQSYATALPKTMFRKFTYYLLRLQKKLKSSSFNSKLYENIRLNQRKILYGFLEKTTHWQALNYLILLAKYHIFCTNGQQDELCFQSFLLRVKDKLQILREIAIAKNSLENFS